MTSFCLVLVLTWDAILVSGSDVEDSRGGVEAEVVVVSFGTGALVVELMLGDVDLSKAVVLCDRAVLLSMILAVVDFGPKKQP
jgi:hypothetical protein